MKTTLESSLPFVAEIAGLSPGTQAFIYARDDELKRRQAVDDAKAQNMRTGKRVLANQKRADLMAATRQVIDHRLITLIPMARMDRANFVQKRLAEFPAMYGLRTGYTPTTKDIRLIRAVLREWEKELAPT